MGCACLKTTLHMAELPIADPSSVYVPLESLNEATVRSVVSVATSKRSPTFDYSERTVLIFLLAIDAKLREIESNVDKQINEQTIQHAKQLRQWLVDENNQPLKWDALGEKYAKIAKENCESMARYYGSQDATPYFEMRMKTRFDDVRQSQTYMKKFRRDGFKPEELKVYWNVEQLETMCPKAGESSEIASPHDPSDADAVENLRRYPVSERNYSGKISYKHMGIQKAVFQVPEGAQIIVLNFANEQSPGGGYLRHALAQEEVMLYNSDGYRALLDLKYGRMGGGYAIPEFGLAYVRNMRFFDGGSVDEHRLTDMMISACYCLSGQELYTNPKSKDALKRNNLAKFRAFMAAAVANSKDDGSNTYLLLGPIGTGAFGNVVEDIGQVFREALETQLMGSKRGVRYAFENIWFVSTEKYKNETFEEIIDGQKSDPHEEA